MNDAMFGCFRCTDSGTSHYFLPGARRPLCGARVSPGEETAQNRGTGGVHFAQPACAACIAANCRRWCGEGQK